MTKAMKPQSLPSPHTLADLAHLHSSLLDRRRRSEVARQLSRLRVVGSIDVAMAWTPL